MHVLIVSCVFPPEPVVSAKTSQQIAEGLVERGHQVTVIAPFPNRPAGRLYRGYTRTLYQRESNGAGFDIIRCFTTVSSESRMVSRLLENISFGLTAGLAILVVGRPDVIYANTWPIFATVMLIIGAHLRKIPVVVSIQDVYPESLISQQRIHTQSRLARWLRTIDRFVARHAEAIIAISEFFATIYRDERGVAAQRVNVVPNWLDSQIVASDDKHTRQFRDNLSMLPNAFLAVYGGNIGVAAGVEILVESIGYINEDDNVYLLVAGEGSQLTACQSLAERIGDKRVLFHTPWPATETSMVLSAADVLVLPTRGNQSQVSLPSKLISYMLAGRPIIAQAISGSELERTIDKAGCGWVVAPDNPQRLADMIREVMQLSPAERKCRGQAGREYALKNLTSEGNLPRVITILERVAAKGCGTVYGTFDETL